MSRLSHLPLAARRLPIAFGCSVGLACGALHAQSTQPAPADTPPSGQAPGGKPVPAPVEPQRVEVNGAALGDTELRRRSTASRIVVGREEIERFGDSTVGDLLKRLPGVTLGGTPGRGGQIRMRGLGNGYTQILLDGERVQGGLSLDSLDPDQIERIEIIRAPTAETGARAIGGTINIITREGFTRKLNDLKASVAEENGHAQSQANWSRADKLGAVSYNVNLGANLRDVDDRTLVRTVNDSDDRTEVQSARSRRAGVNAGAKLQWKLDGGDSLELMPMLNHSGGDSNRDSYFAAGALGDLPFSGSQSHAGTSMTLGRLNGLYKARLGPGRIEARGGVGMSRNFSDTHRTEFDSEDAVPAGGTATFDDRTVSRERSANLNAKYSVLLENGHNIVSGVELDGSRRIEQRTQLQNGAAVTGSDGLPESAPGDNLSARSLRTAAYSQDEWTLDPHWSAYAGLRWEGIRTESEAPSVARSDNLSSVWTPLLHAVWKPDPKGTDQVRMSLTRSYRSPALTSLIASSTVSKHNSETSPDRLGNPDLKPELATGIDIAWERYLSGGGMVSVSAFRRDISDLMRTVTTAVTQSDGSVRYVAQPLNIGSAMTQGVEIDGKLRLSELWSDAPAVDLRANAALYDSRVKGVPGPHNRLDQQAAGSFNLGGDYRLAGLPLTLGGNVNWQPGYTTRLAGNQVARQNAKRVVDVYALYQFNASVRVRLTGSNLGPRVVDSESIVGDESVTTWSQSYVNWRLGLELRL
jgi:outer membrane receptor for ferrienterochelin and colicins